MTDKIKVKGTSPRFDQQELEQRKTARHNQYHLTSESHGVARGQIAFEFLTNVIELANQGYELSDKYPITTAPMSYHAYMRKPHAIITSDLKALDAQVKQQYIADLEAEREEYRVLLTQQLLEAAELKEQKKVEDARKKRLAEIQAEVDSVFKPLTIPE